MYYKKNRKYCKKTNWMTLGFYTTVVELCQTCPVKSREREKCEASFRSRSMTLCGVWGCRTLKKKAVADKKRQQACCRPPPVCDSRQLNSRLKKFYPIHPNISVELMPYRFNHQYTQILFFSGFFVSFWMTSWVCLCLRGTIYNRHAEERKRRSIQSTSH